jgi:hypothetical protein
MNIIFLDIDGVLNSEQQVIKLYRENQQARINRDFCPLAVSNLLHIVESISNTKIVISSTWRKLHTLVELQNFFQAAGFPPELVIDTTPVLGTERGHEIQKWLDNHTNVERFAILDDDSDMVHLMPYLAKTSYKEGLMLSVAEKAIETLKKGPKKNL